MELDPDASLSIKLYLKNVVPIFRSVHGVVRLWVRIANNEAESFMRVEVECASGLKKKFDLAFEEVSFPLESSPGLAVCSHEQCLCIFLVCKSFITYNSHHNSRAQSRETVPAPRR